MSLPSHKYERKILGRIALDIGIIISQKSVSIIGRKCVTGAQTSQSLFFICCTIRIKLLNFRRLHLSIRVHVQYCYNKRMFVAHTEILHTEKTHVRKLKVLLIKFYNTWPLEYDKLKHDLLPNLEKLLEIHRTRLIFSYL